MIVNSPLSDHIPLHTTSSAKLLHNVSTHELTSSHTAEADSSGSISKPPASDISVRHLMKYQMIIVI